MRRLTLLAILTLTSFAVAQEQCPCFATGSNAAQAQIDGIAAAAFAHTSAPTSPIGTATFDVGSTTTDTTNNFFTNLTSGFQIVPSADASSKSYYNFFTETLIPSTSVNTVGTVIGTATQIDDWGVGNLNSAYPFSSIFNKKGTSITEAATGLNTAVNIINNGTINTAFGVDSWVTTGRYVGGHIGVAYGGRFMVDTEGGAPGGSMGTVFGLYNQIQNNPFDTMGTAYGYYTVLNNGAQLPSSVGTYYGFYVDTPLLVNGGNVGASHSYGLYIADQSVHNGLNNPDPWGIVVKGLTRNNLGDGRTQVGDLQITNPGNNAAGHATCFKADRSIGFCSTAIAADGSCTCN
jgi:hypothetical protein